MRIRSLLTIVALLWGVVAQAQTSALLQAFTQELKEKNVHTSTIRSNFTQTRSMSILANDVVKSGVFYFVQPDKMLLSFRDGDYIKMSEGWFETKTGGNISKTNISSNPMLKSLNTTLSACMVGDFEQLTRGFDVRVAKETKEWVVTMIPMRGKAISKVSQIELRFDRGDMSLNIMKLVEKSGDYTKYTFSNKSFNKPIEANLFNIVQ